MLEALKKPLRAARDAWRSHQRQAELQATVPHTTRQDLARDLRQALGVEPGDVLFLHSSLKSLGYVEGGPTAVIGALLDAVGPGGTLMLPAYWLPGGTIKAACETPGYVFDPRVHGTHMGALPEAALAWPGVRRSVHPTHSVAAIGAKATWLTEAHHQAPSVFGAGSPWQRFSTLPEGKVLGLGISMGPVTFYHLVEDEMGDTFPVQVWQEPAYPMPCKDHEGRDCIVPVRAYRPEVVAHRIDMKHRSDLQERFAQKFEAAGLKRNGRVGQAAAWVIPGVGFRTQLEKLALQGLTIYTQPTQA